MDSLTELYFVAKFIIDLHRNEISARSSWNMDHLIHFLTLFLVIYAFAL